MFEYLNNLPICEILFQSIDRDGSGTGFDLRLADLSKNCHSKPVIVLGGAGHSGHLLEGLLNPSVDAVATAHLLNFIGDGLKLAREQASSSDEVNLAQWPPLETISCHFLST